MSTLQPQPDVRSTCSVAPVDAGHGPVHLFATEAEPKLEQASVKDKATGVSAVLTSFRYAIGEGGPLRGTLPLLKMNQTEGFDCPGCAWPDPKPEDRSTFEFCENGAKAVAHESDKRRITADFFAKHSVSEMSQKSDYWLEQQGRLTCPVVLRESATHYEPITWDAAYTMIADAMKQSGNPDRTVLYTSGKATNEAAFAWQVFARQFGTNNLPDCSNMCHESSGRAMKAVLGGGKGTVLLEDFQKTDLIFVIGQNPGTNHPRQLTALQHAKRNGAKIVTINPLPETGLKAFMNPQEVSGMLGMATELTDLYLPVRINGDVALLKGIMKQLLEWDDASPGSAIDHAFVDEFTTGAAAMFEDLRAADWSEIERASGIPRADITTAAGYARDTGKIIVCWCLGISQHKNGAENVQEILNLLLMRGAMGKPGAGACCVRGHSNVQGDRTMGVWDKPSTELLDAIQTAFDFEPPREHGFDSQETALAMHRGDVDVFLSLGGNFLMALPDTPFVGEAMAKVKLSARIGTKLNRADLATGRTSLILPCLGRTESDMRPSPKGATPQFTTTENAMGIVQRSQGKFAPAAKGLKGEVAIICELAAVVNCDRDEIPWTMWANDYDQIRNGIAAVIPGCMDFNEKVRRAEGFELPNGPRYRKFPTHDGRAHFTINPIPDSEIAEGSFAMTTVRSHDQFNTTIYGLHDRYRGIHNARKVVMMNELDLKMLGLKPHDSVTVSSNYNGVQRSVSDFRVVPYPIPRQCLAMYFPEANPLIPIDQIDPISGCPSYKHTIVTVG